MRIEGGVEEDWRHSKWLKIAKNKVLRFLHLPPYIDVPRLRTANDRKLNLLSNGAVESFWDALGLGIEPFLCSMQASSIYRTSVENLSKSIEIYRTSIENLSNIYRTSIEWRGHGGVEKAWRRGVEECRGHGGVAKTWCGGALRTPSKHQTCVDRIF